MLDDEFLEAYQHGIVVVCCDGIKRRFYPRIFTYSADYPEKFVEYDHTAKTIVSRVIISSIRDKGKCPCPKCRILLTDIDRLGTPEDVRVRSELARVDDAAQRRKVEKARNYILRKNLAVSSKKVEEELKDISLTPTDVSCSF